MKIDPRSLIAPVVGILVLVAVAHQTLAALRASGTWQPAARLSARVESPYAGLDAILSGGAPSGLPAALRDPFFYGSGTAPVATGTAPSRPRPTPRPVEPAEPPRPSLTSIIWDEDPRATVRWNGRDFSVRQNAVFADFMVKSIRPTEVVLERGGQQMVLRLGKKGD